MQIDENRAAIEAIGNAFEQLADRAKEKRYRPEVVADIALRSAITICLNDIGVKQTAHTCAHLAEELTRLAQSIDDATIARALWNGTAA